MNRWGLVRFVGGPHDGRSYYEKAGEAKLYINRIPDDHLKGGIMTDVYLVKDRTAIYEKTYHNHDGHLWNPFTDNELIAPFVPLDKRYERRIKSSYVESWKGPNRKRDQGCE